MTYRAKLTTTDALVILLAVFIWQHQGVSAIFNSSQEINPLNCIDESGITSLGRKCRPLEVYNQLEWARMDQNYSFELARYCSCKLVNLDWETFYDEHPSARRTFYMIRGVLQMDKYKSGYPPQLWSDIDVILNGYSIYLSTREYFEKCKNDPSASFFKKIDFERQPHLRDLRRFCFTKVAVDPANYYQYLENLQRINPAMFYQVLETNHMINMVYQASKGCKLFILHRLQEFKKKPDEKGFYVVGNATLRPSDIEDFNQLHSNNNIDLALRDLSLRLFNCRHWQHRAISLQTLEADCPMMLNDSLPSEWFESHSEPGERSMAALKCGCQLLALNSSWVEIINDKNLDIMSKALTKYMNNNQLPVMNDRETTTWEYYAWFDKVMDKFIKNKKMSVKEIVKYKRGQDPADAINEKTGDDEEALLLLRLGCNRLMFNHIKGSTSADAVRPIKYLDNLRYISQDPLFVFHLTLLDANLFKLHALSKMCEPVIH